MGFYRMSYRVLYADTMALGWHHFLTNFKFQCEAREHYFFDHLLKDPETLASVAHVAPVTHEGYSRNLGQVPVGGSVGILVSYEDAGPCSLRFCFRVVRADGVPISCGYQKMVCFSHTGAMIPAPEAFRLHEQTIREKLVAPSFSERVASGVGLSAVFDEETIRLGMLAAAGSREGTVPAPAPKPAGDLVFAFPGTGSVYPELLAEIAREDASAVPLVQEADAITRRVLEAPLTPLLEPAGAAGHLASHPDLAQVVCYLGGVLSARHLMARGLQPDWLVGHSLGEIAALAVGGAFPVMQGVEVVARRARALKPALGVGGMLALTCTESRARALIDALGVPGLEVAVLNGPEQTVVSGPVAQIESLSALAAHLNLHHTRLASGIAFHNRALTASAAAWRADLAALEMGAPRLPVYSPMERGYYTSETSFAHALSTQLLRPLAFDLALSELVQAGARRFVECGGGNAVTGIGRKLFLDRADVTFQPTFSSVGTAARNLGKLIAKPAQVTGVEPVAAPAPRHAQIAVIGMGCVLPGAFDPAGLWKLVLSGRTAVTAEDSPEFVDYLSDAELPVPDKTYTRMRGKIEGWRAGPAARGYATAAQRYLATALQQSIAWIKSALPAGQRTQLLVGSTADGIREYEDALLAAQLAGLLEGRAGRKPRAKRQLAAIEQAVGRALADCADLSPWQLYDAVARTVLGPGVRVRAVDAACASSLYAVSAAVRALGERACDVAFAGGVFTPGAANSCLFAQFRGLSKTGSRPLDASADGVVFSEGAGILALKRLADAEAAGDEVLGVIQGVGLSSDGRSPSVMEPREAGQLYALRRAYASAGIDPRTVDYLEAHATATTVGDAVEVKAAAKVFAGSPRPVDLGSAKANFGHTGWAAGVTSLIKMISALRADTVPPQAVFTQASPRLALEQSVFRIATEPRAWEPPRQGSRRVAINGFGFGGANAHVVMDAPPVKPTGLPSPAAPERVPLAVVAVGASMPAAGGRFAPGEVALPEKMRILPDILDHMDASNVLAIVTAARALESLPNWKAISEETGVALGIEGKLSRGLDANLRVHRDRLRRRLAAQALDDADADELAETLAAGAAAILPSGPYTLPGLMPNVVAGRVTAAFDLRGPNLVIDQHRASLSGALEMAASWLVNGDAKAVLAGALHGHAHAGIERLMHASAAVPESRPLGEGAVFLMLTTEATARALGWPVQALYAPGADATPVAVGRAAHCLMGAEGAVELIAALDDVRRGAGARRVVWPGGESLTFASAGVDAQSDEPAVETATVELGVTDLPATRGSFANQRVLVVTAGAVPPALASALGSTDFRTLVPAGTPGDIAVDLTSDATLAATLPPLEVDHVIIARDLAGAPLDLACTLVDPHADLAFAVARALYDSIGAGRTALSFVTTGAWTALGKLHPATGLFAGLGKSLAGELPGGRVRIVHTGELDGASLLAVLEREIAPAQAPAPVEVAYHHGKRYAARMVGLAGATVGAPLIHAGSLVLAVGGARGVTAVLVESLLERTGCTVALIGRSDPDAVPAQIMALDDAALPEAESTYLAAALAQVPRPKPAAVKARWERLMAAREAALTLARLQASKTGRVVYVQADVTDAAQVDAAVERIARELGQVDALLFGAGVQYSKLLSRRTLEEYRRVLGTKLGGLGHIEQALARHQPAHAPHVHLVSSATGLLGAPGAQDYAAANEVLNRYALARSAEGGDAEWTSVAWTWWRGVGMGAAFDQLPAGKRLPSISREQGKQLFGRLLAGRPVAPVISVYQADDAGLIPDARIAPPPELAASVVDTWQIDRQRMPYLPEHRIDGTPTMPGANLIDLAMRSAMKLRPGSAVVRAHNIRLMRFVKAAKPVNLRAICRVASEDGPETHVYVRLVSDFIHANGQVLRRDDVHSTVTIVLSRAVSPLADHARERGDRSDFVEVPEPYQHPDSRVFVGGPFHRIGRIWAGAAAVESSLRPAAAGEVNMMADAVAPVVLLDALFRITTFEPNPQPVLPVFVPTTCTAVYLPHRKIDPREPLSLEAGRRTLEGNLLRTDWAEARDRKGRVVLRAENLVGLRVGQITVTLGSQEREERQ